MIPVDLNRLREARDEFGWHYREANAEALEVLDAAVAAVLDAPLVWWCWSALVPKCGPDGHVFDDPEYHTDCGPRALVPIAGEGR